MDTHRIVSSTRLTVGVYASAADIETLAAKTYPWTALLVADESFEFSTDAAVLAPGGGTYWPAETPIRISVDAGAAIQVISEAGGEVSISEVKVSA